jgi:hypothetical protein
MVLLNNRLPTKDMLVRCGIRHLDSLLCIVGCQVEETSNHFFFIAIFLKFFGVKFLIG